MHACSHMGDNQRMKGKGHLVIEAHLVIVPPAPSQPASRNWRNTKARSCVFPFSWSEGCWEGTRGMELETGRKRSLWVTIATLQDLELLGSSEGSGVLLPDPFLAKSKSSCSLCCCTWLSCQHGYHLGTWLTGLAWPPGEARASPPPPPSCRACLLLHLLPPGPALSTQLVHTPDRWQKLI